MKKRKDPGSKYEDKLIKRFEKEGLVATKTSNSGATYNNGDIILEYVYMIDSKLQEYRGSTLIKNITVNLNEFKKLELQSKSYGKTPILIVVNGMGDEFAVMNTSTLIQLLKDAKHGSENI